MNSKRILFAIVLISLAALVACGSGGGSIVVPHPSGNYSNASLNGSYAYEIHGFDSGGPFRQVGVFVADGNGNITGGSDDSSASAAATPVNGNYTVAKDGTGLISMNTSEGTIALAITLASSSKVQLIEADSFANAGGAAELQTASAIAATPSGTYVFRLHQEISAQSGAPASEVGDVTLSSGSGNGTMDQNLAGVPSLSNITATLNTPAAFGRGTGTISNSSSTMNLVYYIVNSGKVLLLVSNVSAVGSGSAELQSGAVGSGPNGNYAFGSRGDDSNFAGVATVGQFNAASGTLTVTQDATQDGNILPTANFSSCYTAFSDGSVVVNSVSSNTCTSTVTQVFRMVNPARAFFINESANAVEDGTADLQTSQSLSAASFNGQYSLAMDGRDVNQFLSRVGTLQFDGVGKLTLNEVANGSSSSLGAQSPGIITGAYSFASNGHFTGTLNGNGFQNVVIYAVSPSQAYVLQTDTGTMTSGMLQLQQ